MALYSDKVMDHFQNPRNVGKMENADGIGEVGNAKCGDIMRMYIKVDPKTQVITDVKFNTFGCGSAIATSSMATEMIKGKPISEALQLSNKAVVEALDGLPAHKIHCSVLAEEAVRAAVKDYFDRNGIPYGDEFQACAGHCDTCGHGCEGEETRKVPAQNNLCRDFFCGKSRGRDQVPLCFASYFFRKSTRATTPSLGMAL